MAAVAADGDDDFARGYCYYCCLDREWEEDTVVLLVCWFFMVKGNLESPLPVEGIAIVSGQNTFTKKNQKERMIQDIR